MEIHRTRLPGASSLKGANSSLPSVSYIRHALGDKADLLLAGISLRNGRYHDNNYWETVPVNPGISFTHAGQKVPPIALIEPEEVEKQLSFYPVHVPALYSERYRQQYIKSIEAFFAAAQSVPNRKLLYLDQSLLVLKPNGKMIFISDDHSHATYGFALANHLGIINERVSVIHIDEHEDNCVPVTVNRRLGKTNICRPSLAQVAYYLKNAVAIDQYLAFACRIGILGEENIHYILTHNLNETKAPEYRPGKNHLITGKVCLLQDAEAEVEKKITSGSDVILDLDLDFFAFLHDPLFPEAKREPICNILEDDILPVILRIAQRAKFITLATSPDYFGVPQKTIKRLIGAIVDAA